MTFLNSCLSRIVNRKFKLLNATTKDNKLVFSEFSFSEQDQAKVAIIYGGNGTGKSLIGKLVEQMAKDESISSRTIGMRNRTKAGIERALVFGSDNDQSTGQTSFSAIEKCIAATEKDSMNSVAIFDEPDIGLSRRFSKTLGRYLANKANELADGKYYIVISHNEDMIETLVEELHVPLISLGINTTQNLDKWIKDDSEAPLEELKGLSKACNAKWSAIERSQGC